MRFGVGLWCLQATATSPRHHVTAYRQLRHDAQVMERLGYESLWLSEHHFFYDGYCPALLPAAATVLAVTDRLHVATGMLLAPLQEPHRIATAAADLHERAAGRFELGVGLGYRDVEFDGKGVPRAERAGRQRALLRVLAGSVPEVPVWVGSATPQAVARAGAQGVGVLFSGANPLSLVRTLARAHRQGWNEAGRPGGTPPPVAALRNVWVTENAEERRAVLDCMRLSYLLYAGLGWSVAAAEETDAMDFRADMHKALDDAVATAIIGGPAHVLEGLHEVAEAGVDYVVFRLAIEGAPQVAVHDAAARLADEVLGRV